MYHHDLECHAKIDNNVWIYIVTVKVIVRAELLKQTTVCSISPERLGIVQPAIT